MVLGNIGVILGLYWSYTGTMEKQMETALSSFLEIRV